MTLAPPTRVMMGLSWGVCVGGGLLVVRWFPAMHAAGPWLMATLYIGLVAGYVSWRWRSEGWRRVDVFGGGG